MAKEKKKNPGNKLVVATKKPLPPSKKVSSPKKNNNKVTKVTKADLPKKKKRRRLAAFINFLLSLMMLAGIAAMGCIIAFAAYIVVNAPPFEADKLYNKEATIFYDRDGNEIMRAGLEQRELKSYGELPNVLIDAIVATEDSRFFQHNGFDVARFTKASFGQLAGDSGAGGASTITMQIAKNTFSKNEDGYVESSGWAGIVRKFTDIYMAVFKIERNYTKEEILEFYVNAQFFGSNAYGVEQASQKYFGKTVSDLSLSESAILAGIFKGPTMYNPFYSTENCEERRNIVLDLMVRHEYITEEEAQDAKAIPVESLVVEPKAQELNKYQTFIDMVANEVLEKTGYDPYSTPMLVYTTMEPRVQDVMYDLDAGNLNYQFKKYKYMNGGDYVQYSAAVTNVHDGSIVAVFGRRNQKAERELNLAVEGKFQPGSTAKPIFAYGPYIEYNNGSTGTVFYDNRMNYSNGQVISNADNGYQGAMTMRQALVRSRNIPAVQAFMAVDKDKIAEFVHNCGINYGDNLYEAYAIGGGLEVNPVIMAGAYGTFARSGYYIEPYSFTKVVFEETDEVYEYKHESKQAMSEETAYMITDMLITATQQGVGGNINVSGTQVASKTGTSTYEYAAMRAHNVPDDISGDNWTITYSPDYVIATWYGVETLSHESYVNAIAAANEKKKIMGEIANKIYLKNSKFKRPSGVISAKYEYETVPMMLPSSNTPSSLVRTELFKKGTEPSEVSDRFSQLANPSGGNAEVNGKQINISWDGIATPNAISSSYLEKYFKDNYGQFASIYLKKRLQYNEDSIGTLGYQVYLNTEDGQQLLGYTPNTYYTYSAPTGGSYNFTVKSAYSIFTDNASNGLTIAATVAGEPEPENPENPDNPDNPGGGENPGGGGNPEDQPLTLD